MARRSVYLALLRSMSQLPGPLLGDSSDGDADNLGGLYSETCISTPTLTSRFRVGWLSALASGIQCGRSWRGTPGIRRHFRRHQRPAPGNVTRSLRRPSGRRPAAWRGAVGQRSEVIRRAPDERALLTLRPQRSRIVTTRTASNLNASVLRAFCSTSDFFADCRTE